MGGWQVRILLVELKHTEFPFVIFEDIDSILKIFEHCSDESRASAGTRFSKLLIFELLNSPNFILSNMV